MTERLRTILLVLLCTLQWSGDALAGDEVKIGEPSFLDRQYMDSQRERIDELARRNLGRQINGQKENDLQLLQLLLDRRLVRREDTLELQAMGVVLGDLLAAELGMHWVIYEDALGRSRALRYQQSENYLFPITMISRRREAGNTRTVRDIYQLAYDIIDPLREPLPFQ